MGKKKKKKGSGAAAPEAVDTASEQPQGGSGVGTMRWVALAILFLGAAAFLYASLGERPSTTRKEVTIPAVPLTAAAKAAAEGKPAPYYDTVEEAKPFPVTLPPSHFENAGIANAYQIAKDIPEVLAQQPCLCGCDNASDDHGSLLDCYVDEHAST